MLSTPTAPVALRRRERGFTLIELIVVVGMIGLMFGVVFLKLDVLLPGERLKASARQLASHLDRAFHHAVVSGFPVRFEYDIDHRAYRFLVPFELEEDGRTIRGEGETEILDWTQLPDGVRIADVVIGDGETLNGGVVFVTFEPRGVATPHVVHLASGDPEKFYSVTVAPLFGAVSVASGYRQPRVSDHGLFD